MPVTPAMRWNFWLAMGALGLGACAGSAMKPPAEPAGGKGELPIPEDLRVEIRKAEAIGGALYLLDKVSAIGTDVLVDRVPDYRQKNLGGYLTLREAGNDLRPKDSYMVSFFTKDKPPRVAYEIRVKPDAKPELEAFNPPKAVPRSFALMVQARQKAIAALPEIVQPINPVMIPAEGDNADHTLVYLLAGTNRPDVAVFGRHYRVLVPFGDGPPISVTPLSKSVLEIPTKGPKGDVPSVLFVTHLVTDWPLETHVFVSLQIKKPIYVVTRRGVWFVDGRKISFMSDRAPKDLE